MATSLFGGGSRGITTTPTLRAVLILIACAVFTCRYEFLLVSVVTQSPSFLPGTSYASGRVCTQTVAVPPFPIFTLCMNNIEHSQLDRTHSLIAMRQAGEALKTVMSTITVLLHYIISH